jgi:hypothetical protein
MIKLIDNWYIKGDTNGLSYMLFTWNGKYDKDNGMVIGTTYYCPTVTSCIKTLARYMQNQRASQNEPESLANYARAAKEIEDGLLSLTDEIGARIGESRKG